MISVVSDNCGGHDAHSSSRTKAKSEKKHKG
jgi:hypothetical protein